MDRPSAFITILAVFVGVIFVIDLGWNGTCYVGIPCNLYFLLIFILAMSGVYYVLEKIPDRRIAIYPIPDILDRLLVIELKNKDVKNDFTELRIELLDLKLVGHREIFFDEQKALFHTGRGNEHNRILAGKAAAITLAIGENGITKFLTDDPITNTLFRKVAKPPSDISSKWKPRMGGEHLRAYYQYVVEISGKMGNDKVSYLYKGTAVHWLSKYKQEFDTLFHELRPAELQSGINWIKWRLWLKI